MGLEKTLRRFHAADREWQDRYLRLSPVHPAFWAYRSIEKALAASAGLAKGVLLDAGCGLKPYAPLFRDHVEAHIGMEWGPKSPYRGHRADLFGDVASLPVASGSVDVVLCTELLEHLEDPQAALKEFHRALRPDGLLFLTSPFVYPIHDERDYFRYSDKGLRTLLERVGFAVESLKPLTGTGKTLALLTNIYIVDIGFFWTKWLYPLGVILRPALWLLAAFLNGAGGLADVILPSHHLAFNHLAIARKRA